MAGKALACPCAGFHFGTFRSEFPYVLWRTGIIVEDEDRDNRFMGGSRSCATEGALCGGRTRRSASLLGWALWARRAEDVAPYHVVRTGADTMGTW